MPAPARQAVASEEAASQAFAHPAFASLREAGAPSLIVRGDEPCVVWANRAAAALFEVSDYAGLQRRLIDSSGTTARMLRELLIAKRIGVSPRLERLRWSWGSRIHTMTALCARGVESDGVPTLLLAFVGTQAARTAAAWSEEVAGRPPIALATRPSEAETNSALPQIGAPATAIGEPDEAEGTPAAALSVAREKLRAVLGGADTGRFGWRTDASGAIAQIDENLMRMLGLPLIHDEATRMTEQVAAFDPTGAENLGQAMEEGVTWSGIVIHCPVHDGSIVLPVAMSASPQFDARRRFGGYRGFGRLNLAALQIRPVVVAPLSPVPHVEAEAIVDEVETSNAEPPLPEMTTERSPRVEHAAEKPLISLLPGEGELILSDAMMPPFEGAANVVQLWPLLAPPPVRLPAQAAKLVGDVDAQATPSLDRPLDVVDGEQRTSIEAAVGRSPDRKGALTSSERQAFQEIGRTLGPGPRRATSSFPSGQGDLPSTPTPQPESAPNAETDLTRHAAALVEHMTVGLLVVRSKRVLFANEALREALRFESHSELLDALALHLARLPAHGGEPQNTLVLPSAYGEPVGFSSTSRVIVWNGQPAVLWTLAGLDVVAGASSGRAAAAAVSVVSAGSSGAADLTSALDASGEAIAVVDPAGRILALNAQGERFFGRRRGEIQGQDFTLLLADESRAAAAALLNQLKSDDNKRQLRGECIGRSTDGSSIALEMRIAWLDAQRVTVVWRDLTSQRAIERELAQLRRQSARVGEHQPDFLANVSHQVRSPLNAILGFAEIMMDERFGPLGNPRYEDYLRDIHASGKQVIALIDDLLDLSRIEAGRLDLRLGAIDINKVIADCVTEAHALAHRERIIVRTSLGARLPPVMADEASARQIVGNLLSNAIKFNEPGGQVIVSTASSEPSSVVVRIRDTGIGMSDSDITSALEPFRKLAPTKNASGTGLGLPLTKALATANGASLSMRSRPQEGTMVEVTFQATVAAPARVLA